MFLGTLQGLGIRTKDHLNKKYSKIVEKKGNKNSLGYDIYVQGGKFECYYEVRCVKRESQTNQYPYMLQHFRCCGGRLISIYQLISGLQL
jgi:hypothetical protein